MNLRDSLVLALALTACEVPLDPEPDVLENLISGTVVVNGVEEPGNVILLAFDADNPGPPAGTGSPVSIATVPKEAFTGVEGGLESAEFSFGQLPDGEYLISALLDMDGNFNPFADSLAGATCGDYGGTHVTDLLTFTPKAITVEGGIERSDITIVVGQAVPIQRPAWRHTAEPPVVKISEVGPLPPQYSLSATSIHTNFDPLVLAEGEDGLPLDFIGPCEAYAVAPDFCDPVAIASNTCATALWVYAKDVDQDGEIDPHPELGAFGIKDIWPRIYLTYKGQPVLDGEGNVTGFDDGLPDGEYWAGENFPFAVENTLGTLPIPVGTRVPMREISVTWSPRGPSLQGGRDQ